MRHIGSNALPYLLNAISYQPSAARQKAAALAPRLPRVVVRTLHLDPMAPGSGERRAYGAEFGFLVLGPAAAPAIPELARLAHSTNLFISARASAALVQTGGRGISELAVTLDELRDSNRRNAVWSMGAVAKLHRDEAGAAVPVLVRCLKDEDEFVAGYAAQALGVLRLNLEVSVPALAEQTQNTSTFVRHNVANSLGLFGTQAVAAVPRLEAMLRDSNSSVRKAATNALRKIASEMLEGGHLNGGTNVENRTVNPEH